MSSSRERREACFLWARDVLVDASTAAPVPDRIRGALPPFLQRHQVAGILGDRLSEPQLEALEIDRHLARVLQTASFDQWQSCERLRFALPEIHHVLQAADIEAILLKGPDLAQRFYGYTAARPFSDLDVLVRERDLGEATEALRAAGWTVASTRLDGSRRRRALRRSLHHVELVREGVPLELHHTLRAQPALRIEAESLFRDAASHHRGSGSWSVLSEQHLLLTVLLGLHTDIGLGTATLRSLLDADRILTALDERTDWRRFFEERRDEGTRTLAVNLLALVGRLLGGEARYPKLLGHLGHPALRELRLDPVEPEPAGEFLALFDSAASSGVGALRDLARAKMWTFHQFERSLPSSLLHWAVSLPRRALSSATRFESLRHRRRVRREQTP